MILAPQIELNNLTDPNPYPPIRYIFTPTLLFYFKKSAILPVYFSLPVYKIWRKIPAYPFIWAYPFIREVRVMNQDEVSYNPQT